MVKLSAIELKDALIKCNYRRTIQPETQIKKSIIQWLELKKHLVVNVYAGGYRLESGAFRPQPHLKKGTADLIVCLNPEGLFVAFEIKSLKGKVSDNQLNWMDEVIKSGGEAIVVRSIDDVENAINEIRKRRKLWKS